MTRQAFTQWQAETVNELVLHAGVVEACRLVGRSRATHHRQAHPKLLMHGPYLKPQHPAELTSAERAVVLALLTDDEYAEMSCHQVWARELDAGKYWCSPRTMYRILAAAGMGGERRRQASHQPRAIPELVATEPGSVWSWDITKLSGPTKGCWYHAYVVLDIFSRYVVGWRIEAIEDGDLAAELVADIVTEQGRTPDYLHADGGAAMTSKPLASLGEARAWMDGFVSWYNHEHRHSGIGWHTPASVYYGTADEIRDARQQTLNAAYAAHPERFARPPAVPQLPTRVTINDPAKRGALAAKQLG